MPVGYERSVFMAVIFPEIAALAAVLAAPGWQTLAASDAQANADRFLRAAQHALGCADPPHRHDISDAVTTWMRTSASGPLLQPASTYPDTGHHDDGTPRVTDQQRLAEGLTVIHFGRDRRAPRIPSPGAPMPYAHRPTPVGAGRGPAENVSPAKRA
jgi:hypothetical protein